MLHYVQSYYTQHKFSDTDLLISSRGHVIRFTPSQDIDSSCIWKALPAQAPVTSPAPDVHMHEEHSPDNIMPQVDAVAEAPDQAETHVQQADVDDDMDEDEEVCNVSAYPCNAAGSDSHCSADLGTAKAQNWVATPCIYLESGVHPNVLCQDIYLHCIPILYCKATGLCHHSSGRPPVKSYGLR